MSHYENFHLPEPSALVCHWRAGKEKTPNSSSLCQHGDGYHDLISENTLEKLSLQDVTKIYKPNGKSRTVGKVRLYALP
jgi:hypothetical protein